MGLFDKLKNGAMSFMDKKEEYQTSFVPQADYATVLEELEKFESSYMKMIKNEKSEENSRYLMKNNLEGLKKVEKFNKGANIFGSVVSLVTGTKVDKIGNDVTQDDYRFLEALIQYEGNKVLNVTIHCILEGAQRKVGLLIEKLSK